MPSPRRTFRVLTVAAAAAVVSATAACSGPAPSAAPPSSASTAPPASAGAGAPITVPLQPAPAGTAALSWNPSTKQITATINAYGFTPGSAHAMHIHPGTCANQNQPPSIPFPDVAADPSGAAKDTVTSQAAPAGIPTGSYLNIHLAPMAQLGSPKDVSFTPILCADIPAGTPAAGPVTLTLQPPAPPKGSATLTYNATAHTLAVSLKASGLKPGTAHAVHIHTGSCRAQGDVLYPLPDLTADAQGNAQETATVDKVTGAPPAHGWYVNVHFAPMSQILQNGKPTLLFAPILCGDVTG
jgi:Cu/Zn superoxide dismutase